MPVSKDGLFFVNKFRRDIFNVCLDYLESEVLTEQEVCGAMKQCIEFFWSDGGPGERMCDMVVQDFCLTKIARADRGTSA